MVMLIFLAAVPFLTFSLIVFALHVDPRTGRIAPHSRGKVNYLAEARIAVMLEYRATAMSARWKACHYESAGAWISEGQVFALQKMATVHNSTLHVPVHVRSAPSECRNNRFNNMHTLKRRRNWL
jgi:hypothetical protein